MNDYSNLLTRLQNVIAGQTHHTIVDEAKDAIETLIAKRDAALNCLETIATKTGDGCEYCIKCPTCKRCTGFEWVGVQKEVHNGAE